MGSFAYKLLKFEFLIWGFEVLDLWLKVECFFDKIPEGIWLCFGRYYELSVCFLVKDGQTFLHNQI